MSTARRSDGLRAKYETEGATTRRYDAEQFWDRRYHQRRFEHVHALLADVVRCGDTFLDVGCGTGEYLSLVAGFGARAVGVDLSESYCRRLASSARVGIVGDASRLPIASATCDVVLCSEVIEHLPPSLARRCVDEITRIARRAAIVTTPNASALVRRVAQRIAPARVRELDTGVGHVNLLAAADLVSMLDRPGWVLSRFDVHHVVPPLVGDGPVRLPSGLASMAGRVETMADRWFGPAGNLMVALLESTST